MEPKTNTTTNGKGRSLKRLVMQRECDHACHCGTSTKKAGAHETEAFGCGRVMCAAPRKKSCTDDMWIVDGHTITGYTLRFQRHYHQHPCGCWSKWGGDAKLHNKGIGDPSENNER